MPKTCGNCGRSFALRWDWAHHGCEDLRGREREKQRASAALGQVVAAFASFGAALLPVMRAYGEAIEAFGRGLAIAAPGRTGDGR